MDAKKNEVLLWSPWIGRDYRELPNDKKVLFIGESHYLNKSTDSKPKHENPNWTRIVVEEQGVRRQYYSKFFKGIHQVLFQDEDFDSEALWAKVSFYNFIQRPMESVQKRPTKNDLLLAWEAFEQVLLDLKPRYCVFWGLGMSNYFNHLKIPNSGLHYIERIGNCESRGSRLTLPSGNPVDLIFVKHPSRKSHESQWNRYLKEQLGDTMSFLIECN